MLIEGILEVVMNHVVLNDEIVIMTRAPVIVERFSLSQPRGCGFESLPFNQKKKRENDLKFVVGSSLLF